VLPEPAAGARSARLDPTKRTKLNDPVIDLYGINPHNKGSEFDPSRKEKIKWSANIVIVN
jgi:hypothetical protein